uniref:Uncharacterized protein n=1 Tax=Arundo donax TaxID=35708 RepID=A0A0A9ANB1_ARUDO
MHIQVFLIRHLDYKTGASIYHFGLTLNITLCPTGYTSFCRMRTNCKTKMH